MTIRSVLSIVAALTVTVGTGAAFAGEDPWGTVEDGAKCTQEMTDKTPEFINGGWIRFKKGVPAPPDNATADCKAEINKRADACLQDPAMQALITKYSSPKIKEKNAYLNILKSGGDQGPHMVCEAEAWSRLTHQRDLAAVLAKQAASRKAAAEKTELPTAGKKDATIEAMVKATYSKAFPSATVLGIIIVGSDWSTDRNDFGTVIDRYIQVAVVNQQKDVCEIYSEAWSQQYIGGAFKGPLSEAGAGSLTRSEIVCSKVKGAKK
jgi:hypothetical protein